MYILKLSWLTELVIFCSAHRLQPLNRQQFDKHLCHKLMGEEAVYLWLTAKESHMGGFKS